MLIGFNDTLKIFTAKGSDDHDVIEVVREPSATRPLGLKNTDVKTISGAVHFLTRSNVAKGASRLQNGFIQGRNFINNIVDLDTQGRIIR